MNPTQRSPERAFALQKYLLLHSQHDALQKHLDQITSTTRSSSHSHSHSPSISPNRHHNRYHQRQSSIGSSLSSSPESPSAYLSQGPISPPNLTRPTRRSGSIPALSTPSISRPPIVKRRSSLPPVIDESILGEIEEDEEKLKSVNEQIKHTLTELLNCESVRRDGRYRMWVQTRLMDAERELKSVRAKSCDRRRESDVGLFY